MGFVYLLSEDAVEGELARAELWALTGAEAAEGDRAAFASVACDVTRAAYVSTCAEILAETHCLDDLVDTVRDLRIEGHQFRIDVRREGPEASEPVQSRAPSPEVAGRLAEIIDGSPNLGSPRERFLALAGYGAWRFCRVLSRSRRDHVAHVKRPRNFSNALPVRYARAMVNLVAAPGDLVVDPCCGMGTCLIEAASIGARAAGFDLSKPTIWAARENLAHFGLDVPVQVADARELEGEWDAAVLDLPYGHTVRIDDDLHAQVLANLAPRVRRLAVVTGGPSEEVFAQVGVTVLRCARVPKSTLVRHFYALTGLLDAGPRPSATTAKGGVCL